MRTDLLRFRAMYVTSLMIGWVVAVVWAVLNGMLPARAGDGICRNARKHAVDAARKRGPYLAPVTVAVVLLAVPAVIAGVVL